MSNLNELAVDDKASLHGLSCPQCGGVIHIPEGQAVIRCPYCDLRSFVRGDRGLRRYQVTPRIDRQKAVGALNGFFSNWAVARDAKQRATLSDAFLVYLPFWAVWGRVAAWAFGEERVGSGDNKRYEPREVRVVQDMAWNGAACDVGEFGVGDVPLAEGAMEAFDQQVLHRSGMVFEPAGSFAEARAAADQEFERDVKRRTKLDRLSQVFQRSFRQRSGLVYYPLWVLRYLYRERAFQVVVDGYSGRVLYGKAPGNTIFRAGALVLGMALGALLAVDGPAFTFLLSSDTDDGVLGMMVLLFLAGLAVMGLAYRTFRYGEYYELRTGRRKVGPLQSLSTKEVEVWIDRLTSSR